jgi:methyltransferase (TIGR00027 family)
VAEFTVLASRLMSRFLIMDNEGPSRTALTTAYARAYHQIADQPRILTDPLAARLLGVTAEELTELGRPAENRPGSGGISHRPYRLFFAARARFAEDRVAAAAATGVRQVVILGAGLDTFAYRNPHPDLRVFEVDHPATQAWKHQRLAASGIDQPGSLTFVPVDFETDTLAAGLESAGFSRTDPAVFVWLGVVFYLTPDAARTTLEYIARQSEPVEVIFDYLQPSDTDEDRAQLQARADRVAAAGEPWFSYFTPDDIAAQLRALGFTDVEDHSATDLIAGYLDGSAEFEGEPPQALRPSRILRASR